MFDCQDVVSIEPYHQTGSFYDHVISDRFFQYIKRHGLMSELVREDAAGKR